MRSKQSDRQIFEGKSRLFQAILEGGDLYRLIKLGEELIGKPFALNTINHFSWYVSPHMPQNRIIPQTGGATVNISCLHNFQDIFRLFLDNESSYQLFDTDEYRLMFCPIYDSQRLLGYSCLLSAVQFRDCEVELHRIFCQVIAVKLAKHEIASRVLLLSTEEALLINILDNTFEDNNYPDVKQWFPEGTYMETIVVQMREYFGNLAPLFGAVEEIKTILQCDICFGYYGSLVAFSVMGSARAHSKEFSSVLSRYDMMAGVSYPFNRLDKFRTYYEQAQTAVRIGGDPSSRVLFYTDCVFRDLIGQLKDSDMLIYLCNCEISRLAEYDKANNTQLARTLQTWFESDQSTAKTAAKLGIHRNSVLRRMETIRDLVADIDIFTLDGYFSLLITSSDK